MGCWISGKDDAIVADGEDRLRGGRWGVWLVYGRRKEHSLSFWFLSKGTGNKGVVGLKVEDEKKMGGTMMASLAKGEGFFRR